MRLLDLITLHQDRHENAVLWILRAGPSAGMTSLAYMPNCFAISITDPRLTVQVLEQMLYEYQAQGCLVPNPPHRIINGEHFLPLLVAVDEAGQFSADCQKPCQLHG